MVGPSDGLAGNSELELRVGEASTRLVRARAGAWVLGRGVGIGLGLGVGLGLGSPQMPKKGVAGCAGPRLKPRCGDPMTGRKAAKRRAVRGSAASSYLLGVGRRLRPRPRLRLRLRLRPRPRLRLRLRLRLRA